MVEEFRKIKGYDNYLVSNFGKIISDEHELKQYKNFGHFYVYLYKNKVRKKFYVHRLVAEAFVPNPFNYPIINHKDENGLNNNSTNLEWCTYSYNINYGTYILRRSKQCKKKICQKDKRGNTITVFDGIIDAANFLSIDPSSITKAASGKRKSAGGYLWEYER